MLSDVEKPSFVVVIRSGGGACCARHAMDEKFLYDKTLEKLKKKLGSRLGTEIPEPRYQDLIHLNYGSSAGNIVSSALAMGKTLDDVIEWWPRIGPDIVPIAHKKRQLLFRSAALALSEYSHSTNENGSAFDEKVMKVLARFGSSLSSLFAAKAPLLSNNNWDKYLGPMGFCKTTLSQSDTSVIYGAHLIEEGRPVYFGFLRPEILSAEYSEGLLLNKMDLSHATLLKGAMAIPFIFEPVKIAEGQHVQDLATVDGPYNLMSWITRDMPLSPKYGTIKVIHLGSGDRFKGVDPGELIRRGPIAAYDTIHKGIRNHQRRPAFATIQRNVEDYNERHAGVVGEKSFFTLDIPDEDVDFTDTSKLNIDKIMTDGADTSRRINARAFEELSDLLAENYVKEWTLNREMELAHQSLIDLQRGTPVLDPFGKGHYAGEKAPANLDINDQMGPFGPVCESDCSTACGFTCES
ncbi:MAG: hypothetical protein LRY54_03320 [Alphaproteobacteria bacterium]|nr:hypothetical protein [Alphaproteobacteria bacterium]